jgi:hypothetical protein
MRHFVGVMGEPGFDCDLKRVFTEILASSFKPISNWYPM